MLVRNYDAIAKQTAPTKAPKSVRKHRSWAWNPKARKPGPVTVTRPTSTTTQGGNTQC